MLQEKNQSPISNVAHKKKLLNGLVSRKYFSYRKGTHDNQYAVSGLGTVRYLYLRGVGV